MVRDKCACCMVGAGIHKHELHWGEPSSRGSCLAGLVGLAQVKELVGVVV